MHWLQIFAILFLIVSAAFFFVPQILAYGAGQWRELARNGQVQFVLVCLISIFVAVLFAPGLRGEVITEHAESESAAVTIFAPI